MCVFFNASTAKQSQILNVRFFNNPTFTYLGIIEDVGIVAKTFSPLCPSMKNRSIIVAALR
jgi:hypothetical protein